MSHVLNPGLTEYFLSVGPYHFFSCTVWAHLLTLGNSPCRPVVYENGQIRLTTIIKINTRKRYILWISQFLLVLCTLMCLQWKLHCRRITKHISVIGLSKCFENSSTFALYDSHKVIHLTVYGYFELYIIHNMYFRYLFNNLSCQ